MAYRRGRLQTGVKAGRRINRTLPENATDDLVSAGVAVEIELGRDVAEQVGVYPHPGKLVDGVGDLVGETSDHLWTSPYSGEEGSTIGRRQPGAKLPKVAFDQLDALLRHWVIERLAVLDLLGLYDNVHRCAASWADEVPIEIEPLEIANAHWRHQEYLDGDGHLSFDGAAVRSWIASGGAHQLVRELEQSLQILRVVKLSETRPISLREAGAAGLKASNYCPWLVEVVPRGAGDAGQSPLSCGPDD